MSREKGVTVRIDITTTTVGACHVLAPAGEIDVATAEGLGEALSEALEDADEGVCTIAAYALAAIGPDAADAGAVPALTAALKHTNETMRSRSLPSNPVA